MTEIDVEALLVWAFRDQRGDRLVAERAVLLSLGDDSVARLMARAQLGCRVDGGGDAPGLAIDPDADHVVSLVALIGGETADLLIRHGLAGSRPDWGADVRYGYGPCLDNGGVLVERGEGRVPYCPIMLSGTGEVLWRRRQWTTWYTGLAVVAYGLRADLGRLRRWQVTGPGVAPEPWTAGWA